MTAEGEEAGGLFTTVFADGDAWPVGRGHAAPGEEAGDLNTNNFSRLWSTVRWGGGTEIMPAVELQMQHYAAEFGSKPVDKQPSLALAVITDGMLELNDSILFDQWLSSVSGKVYVAAVVIGFGEDHDAAYQQWFDVSKKNNHVIAFAASGKTDAKAIAQQLLARMQ